MRVKIRITVNDNKIVKRQMNSGEDYLINTRLNSKLKLLRRKRS